MTAQGEGLNQKQEREIPHLHRVRDDGEKLRAKTTPRKRRSLTYTVFGMTAEKFARVFYEAGTVGCDSN